jgi:hypothetical protein
MPPKKPKKKRAQLKRATDEEDPDDDEREDLDGDCEESAVRYGEIAEMFRLEEEEVLTQGILSDYGDPQEQPYHASDFQKPECPSG